jgi:hypothetical protein
MLREEAARRPHLAQVAVTIKRASGVAQAVSVMVTLSRVEIAARHG